MGPPWTKAQNPEHSACCTAVLIAPDLWASTRHHNNSSFAFSLSKHRTWKTPNRSALAKCKQRTSATHTEIWEQELQVCLQTTVCLKSQIAPLPETLKTTAFSTWYVRNQSQRNSMEHPRTLQITSDSKVRDRRDRRYKKYDKLSRLQNWTKLCDHVAFTGSENFGWSASDLKTSLWFSWGAICMMTINPHPTAPPSPLHRSRLEKEYPVKIRLNRIVFLQNLLWVPS